MLRKLQDANPLLPIFSIRGPSFSKYGRAVDGYDFTPWLNAMEETPMPEEGNIYVADEAALSNCGLTGEVQKRLFADMPVQVGYCNGKGDRLNALEYHKTPELNVAATDLVLLLADARDMVDGKINSDKIKGYYLPKGAACEIYGTTLHFAPCKATAEGFKCVVVLPLGTNSPYESLPAPVCQEDEMLWMKGKWLIAYEDSPQAAKGAYVGIKGEKIVCMTC